MIDLVPSLAAGDPIGHVTDKPIYGQWYFSNVTLMLIASGIVTAWIILPAAKRIATGNAKTIDDFRAKGLLANFVEVICLYLREEVFRPLLKEETDKYVPVLWTFFWFILVSNLLGLIPFADLSAVLFLNQAIDPETGRAIVDHGQNHYYGFGGTATQSIWVTGTLATISFIWFNGIAIRKDPKAYLLHMTGGAPWFMWPIMIPVEIIGTFVKPFALALRLFANMSGGHIIVATLLGFVVSLGYAEMGGIHGHGLALIPLLGTIAIYMLELMVAFLQAFIFTFLSSLFLSQLVVHEHEHHDEHDDEHAHGEHGHAHDKHAHAH